MNMSGFTAANRQINGKVTIKDSFWDKKLDTFYHVTLDDTFDKLEKDGVIENYENLIAGNLYTHKACPWHDGLLLETIRGASDYLTREPNPRLEKRIDGYVDVIEKAQLSSGGGYLSTYTQLDRPNQRYGENGGSILWQHDLYNQGALYEAGVHYHLATGKIKLLECALRSANDVSQTIGEPPKKWVVPGHSLAEYALLELYQLVTEHPEIEKKSSVPVHAEDYLTLVNFWVHGRGFHEKRTNHPQYMGEYAQDHAPIEHQVQAVGHAVRAALYYTGVTRLAIQQGDERLLKNSIRLWDNVEQRKMHINGGIGATHFEEKFGEDYDLVNTAYLETCASVGLIFWAESLSRATGDAKYFQVVERSLYNLMLSSVTLQGDSYFYRNPLQSDGSDHHWAWHGCPCCPPMIHKTFGMFDRFVYSQDESGIFVNLYVAGNAHVALDDNNVDISTETELPWEGSWNLHVDKADKPFLLRVRIPYWKTDISFKVNGEKVDESSIKVVNGYAAFTVDQGDTVSFTDSMPAVRVEAHPYVRCDRGLVAIMRGPVVYCAEGVDNHGETDFTIPEHAELTVIPRSDLLGGIYVIKGKRTDGAEFTAVPLYVWDNRMAGKMAVWLKQQNKPDTWDTTGWDGLLYRKYID